jgi:hypothetical protein
MAILRWLVGASDGNDAPDSRLKFRARDIPVLEAPRARATSDGTMMSPALRAIVADLAQFPHFTVSACTMDLQLNNGTDASVTGQRVHQSGLFPEDDVVLVDDDGVVHALSLKPGAGGKPLCSNGTSAHAAVKIFREYLGPAAFIWRRQ